MPVRFLIVDDAPSQQRLLGNVVMFLGGESRRAANGYQALEMVQRETFEVVLMDLHMPELNGLETADQMLQNWSGRAHRPLILAVTGDTRNDSLALCRAIGMDGFIAKPYTVQTLRDAFKELLIRKFAWLDGPSRRILSLQKLNDTLPKHQGDFEVQALEMRSALTDLHRNLPMMKLEDCSEKAQGIAYFAHRYGFVALEHTMQSLINAAKQGQVTSCEPLLRKQIEEFELAYEAVRSWRSQTSLPAPQMMIA